MGKETEGLKVKSPTKERMQDSGHQGGAALGISQGPEEERSSHLTFTPRATHRGHTDKCYNSWKTTYIKHPKPQLPVMRAKALVAMVADNRLTVDYLRASQGGVCALKEHSYSMWVNNRKQLQKSSTNKTTNQNSQYYHEYYQRFPRLHWFLPLAISFCWLPTIFQELS